MSKSEKTRQFIIEKTAPIFNKKGFVGTYLSDLTDSTGLTKGSIYGNFKDKNEVAIEAFRYNYAFQTHRITSILKAQESEGAKLLAFLNYFSKSYRKIFENGGCAILNTAIDADDGNELLKKEVIIKINAWRDTIVAIVQSGIDKNELKNTNPEKFANYMIAVIEGSIMLAKTLGEPRILQDNLAELELKIHALIN